jgi:glycosyltransferase involved in cell wall biosynthesis
MQLVSFILPTRDNLEYLKMAYNSIRKNNGYEHEICIADDMSKDNT